MKTEVTSPNTHPAVVMFFVAALLLCLSACQYSTLENSNASLSADEIAEIHDSILTLDTHIDIPIQLGTDAADPSLDGPMQVDLPKMRSGGLDTGFFIVYVAQGPVTLDGYSNAYRQSQDKFNAIERMLEQNPDEIALARTPDELRAIRAEGKLVAMVGVENAYPLGSSFAQLQEFYDRGARYISLTHFGHNHFGDSSVGRGDYEDSPEPINQGLSDLGLSLIDEMNRLGIMVDVSHTSPESTIQAAQHSAAPVIASHSNVRALFDHPRNMNDDEIRAVAEAGGVVQVTAFDAYLRELSEENQAAIANIREELNFDFSRATQEDIFELRNRVAALNSEWPRANVATLVDNVEYITNLVGIDHAGISSDFGGGGGIQGWDHAGETLAVTEEMLARGYSVEEIEKIWSGNLLRVWREVEEVSNNLALEN